MAFGIKTLADDRGSQMNAGYLRVTVALWIVALVAGGYAESYPTRPTASELDDIVEQGMECVSGMNERCQATQYQIDPVAYRVAPFTNTTGFYLDQNLMGAMATNIKSLVQYYVDTNIVMLTVPGLWARLEIGDHTDQFTCMPAIGTNAATYGDCPWRIYVANLQERYEVLWKLKQTKGDSWYSGYQKWAGHGFGHTLNEAYADAVDSYDYISSGASSPDWGIRQHCKITFFSNSVFQGGSGGTTETGEDGVLQWYDVGYSGEGVPNKLWVRATTTQTVTVITNWTTNVIVTGALNPDITGTYVEGEVQNNARVWYQTNGIGVLFGPMEPEFDPPPAVSYLVYPLTEPWGTKRWYRAGDVEGDYDVWDPDVATGTPTAVFDMIMSTIVTNVQHPTPPCVGDYVGSGSSWSCGSWHCEATNGTYYITESTEYPPESSPSWSHGSLEGEYAIIVGGETYDNVTASMTTGGGTVGGDEYHKYPINYPHNWIDGDETNTIFYECWLTKIVATNDLQSITNIEHRVKYWFKPIPPTYGTSNIFNNEGIGLTVNTWNNEGEGSFTYATNSPVFTWDGVVEDAPDNCGEPTVPGQSLCSGFFIDSKSAILDWDFQHCTDK
ncbi:MAG: hypothetical protein KJ964_01800 [Verrucomicrobia bacterium]|nr:hypothetical protein [Verrucomicrobiota bacterium]MBU1857833.1 hypothetical protein [Verrucomicrobiota bacterium]